MSKRKTRPGEVVMVDHEHAGSDPSPALAISVALNILLLLTAWVAWGSKSRAQDELAAAKADKDWAEFIEISGCEVRATSIDGTDPRPWLAKHKTQYVCRTGETFER